MKPLALYLVTREDLSPGQRAVQAAHALREFQDHCPFLDKEWHEMSNTLAILLVPGEEALRQLSSRASDLGILWAPFYEPDRANELTAVAFEPSQASKRLCRNLKMF